MNNRHQMLKKGFKLHSQTTNYIVPVKKSEYAIVLYNLKNRPIYLFIKIV